VKKERKEFSLAVWAAVAVGAIGIGVIVAFLAGYFLGHFTGHDKTTTVGIVAAPSSAEGKSQETPEPAEEETSEPEEVAGGEAAAGEGAGEEATAKAPPESAKPPAGEGSEGGGKEASGAEAAMLATGKGIVENTCSSCHTLSEAGVGPNLDELKPSKALVEKQVTNGGAVMPAFKGTLSSAEIEAVAEYVSKVAGTGNSSAG
jgi:sulfite dehydrogenase